MGITTSEHNDEIDAGTRKQIHELNTQIIQSFKGDNLQFIYDLFSDEAKNSGLASLREFSRTYAKTISNNDFIHSHDYYVKYMGLGKTTFPVSSETKPKLFIHLNMSIKSPKFVSLLQSQGNFEDYILSFIYQKEKTEWKLQTCHLGIIRIANKGVMDWYSEAEGMYEKAHYLSALLRLSVAGQILRPAPFIQYEDDKKVKKLNDKCRSHLELIKFPHEVQLPTKPQVLSIAPQFVKGDLIPLVNYLSSIPFGKETELKSEAHNILPELKRLFPDISYYSDFVAFKAFNEMPSDPQKQYATYGVVVEVKNR